MEHWQLDIIFHYLYSGLNLEQIISIIGAHVPVTY